MKKITLKIPKSWQDNDQLTSSHMAKLFKVSCARVLNEMVFRGHIPKANVTTKKQNFWTVEYLRKFEGQEFLVAKQYGSKSATLEDKRNQALLLWAAVHIKAA